MDSRGMLRDGMIVDWLCEQTDGKKEWMVEYTG
jgi:hypothetical protein